jgi:hypothetical protein
MSFNNIVSVSPVIPDPLLVNKIQSKEVNNRYIDLNNSDTLGDNITIQNGITSINIYNDDAILIGSNFSQGDSIATKGNVDAQIQAKFDDLLTEGGDLALPDPLYVNTILNKDGTNAILTNPATSSQIIDIIAGYDVNGDINNNGQAKIRVSNNISDNTGKITLSVYNPDKSKLTNLNMSYNNTTLVQEDSKNEYQILVYRNLNPVKVEVNDVIINSSGTSLIVSDINYGTQQIDPYLYFDFYTIVLTRDGVSTSAYFPDQSISKMVVFYTYQIFIDIEVVNYSGKYA